MARPGLAVAHHPPGGDEHREGLEQLGWLHAHGSQAEPPVGPVDLGADEEHRQQQDDDDPVGDMEGPRVILEGGEIHLGQGQHEGDPDAAADELAGEEGRGGGMVLRGLDGGGRVDPHHPHSDQGQGEQHQPAVHGTAHIRGHVRPGPDPGARRLPARPGPDRPRPSPGLPP